MVSFSNGCVSGDAPNKRPLENSHVPKYKPRKVSAVRDFPPWCGRHAVLMDMSPEQNGSSAPGVIEGLGFKNSEIGDSVMVNGVESSGMSKKMEPNRCKTAEMSECVKLDELKNSEVAGCPSVKNCNVGVPYQLDEAVRNNEDVNMTEQMEASVEIKPQWIQLPKDGVNNPLELERFESLDAIVGKVTTTAITDGSLNDVDKLYEIKNDSSKDSLLCHSQVPASSPGNILPETSIRPKSKFCRRRVSAVRDFPPHCGRNAPLPTESIKLKVTSGKSCLDKNVKVEVDPEEPRHAEEGAKGEMAMASQKERFDEVDNILVTKETTETLDDGGRGPVGEMMEDIKEGGAMDSEECNRQAVPGSRTMSNALSDTSAKDAEIQPVGRELAIFLPNRNDSVWTPRGGFSTGDESSREIVYGLMAASHYSRRKGKVIINNLDGGASGVKVQKQILSRQKKSEAGNHQADCFGGQSVEKDICPASYHPDGMDEEDNGASDESVPLITPISVAPPLIDSDGYSPRKEIIVYSSEKSDEMRNDEEANTVDVHGRMTAPDHPSTKTKSFSSEPDGKVSEKKKGKQKLSWRQKTRAVARKSTPKAMNSGSSSKKHNKISICNSEDESPSTMVPTDDEADNRYDDFPSNSHAKEKKVDIEVTLPPFGPKSSGNGDARNRVRETLRMFNAFCRKLIQQEESSAVQEEERKSTGKRPRRIDLFSAKMIKDIGKEVNTEKQYLGQVPGVEVGDEFQYRVELAVVGIHRLYQAGIDWMKVNGKPVATSIVSSGAYSDDVENADVLIYSGQGGNVVGKCKVPEDQKLERGNLALRNSIDAKTPVRVVRGWKEARVMDPLDPKPKMVTTYVYDGLYTVKDYWTETGPHGKQVFMFELRRNPGQPELAWKELKKSNKFKVRPGMVVSDISGGKEPLAICAVNNVDDEKPPLFNYTSKMMYPEWFIPKPPAGCDCTGRCSDSKKCRCSVRNGGEIPYNHNGAIVETKPLVYECGPHCRCPPSCYNRVTQRGIKFPLEIFKTDLRGWGVRALTSVPSGSFICEYAGELLEDKEAEQRIGNDEYLFDIGQNYTDTSVNTEEKAALVELAEGAYTIDAAQYGNIGRFINHSCSPNLYAQNVIYDHDDKKMPHVMLFAMENIPPLQELTYHYNYSVDQIRDSNGNIKVKKCYCGSAECTGRMY